MSNLLQTVLGQSAIRIEAPKLPTFEPASIAEPNDRLVPVTVSIVGRFSKG